MEWNEADRIRVPVALENRKNRSVRRRSGASVIATGLDGNTQQFFAIAAHWVKACHDQILAVGGRCVVSAKVRLPARAVKPDETRRDFKEGLTCASGNRHSKELTRCPRRRVVRSNCDDHKRTIGSKANPVRVQPRRLKYYLGRPSPKVLFVYPPCFPSSGKEDDLPGIRSPATGEVEVIVNGQAMWIIDSVSMVHKASYKYGRVPGASQEGQVLPIGGCSNVLHPEAGPVRQSSRLPMCHACPPTGLQFPKIADGNRTLPGPFRIDEAVRRYPSEARNLEIGEDCRLVRAIQVATFDCPF